MIKNIKQLAAAGTLALLSANAVAVPVITGTLDMTGSFFALDATGARTSDASTAVAIDFDFFGTDRFRVISGSDAFSGLDGQMGDITDFEFDSFSSPIADFWSIDAFSFELTSITRETSADPSLFLRLSGEGYLSAMGYADTFATWSFAGSGSGSSVFSWSASTTEAVPTPEPGVLALLSIGLIGLGLRRKSRI